MPQSLPAPHFVLHDFLPAAQHQALLAWTLTQESRFTPAGIAGKTIDNSIRRCERLNDLGPFQSVFTELLIASYPAWLDTLDASAFIQTKVELQIAAYGDGAHFAFHTDTGSGTSHAPTRRMLTAIYYFYRSPKLFTGGDLRLYDLRSRPSSDPNSDSAAFVTIAPEQNSLLVFPSELGHEVTPIIQSTGNFADFRFVVNCWLHRST
jgi:SM-20-related protein